MRFCFCTHSPQVMDLIEGELLPDPITEDVYDTGKAYECNKCGNVEYIERDLPDSIEDL